MKELSIKPVTTRQELNDFLRVTRNIYKDYPQWVPDLEGDVRDMLTPKKNAGLSFSQIQPFVAYADGVPAGRIVGIINHRANERWQEQVVRFSMIEFIDDADVSKALLDAVERWGRQAGMTTLQGPMGITDFDKEGMLISDFHLDGTINTIWNPPYYPLHLEALGFQKAVDWVQIRIRIPEEIPMRYRRVSQYIQEQLHLRIVKLTQADVFQRGYGQRIFQLLNDAYAPIFGFSMLSERQIDLLLDKYLKFVDLQLVPVVFNEKDEVVGVAITMGCLTQAMQKSKGRLMPFGWFYLLRAQLWHSLPSVLQQSPLMKGGKPTSAEMLLIAVRSDYQGLGVNALFFDDLIPIYNQYGFQWAETGPQLEDNVRELSQWKPLHPEQVKRRRCYTKKI